MGDEARRSVGLLITVSCHWVGGANGVEEAMDVQMERVPAVVGGRSLQAAVDRIKLIGGARFHFDFRHPKAQCSKTPTLDLLSC
ncbi:MAG: hypothetical protein JNK11_08850 [Alphaproteobacteria bacterium]|nr:hypothetical protein [Alphaproteobacteria bacterium]